jgi:hypothetical protein
MRCIRSGRKQLRENRGIILASDWKNSDKPQKYSVRIADVPGEI